MCQNESELVFLSEQAKYEQYNFHRPDWVANLAEFVGRWPTDDSRLTVLSGPSGIGRTYFLEAALWEARRQRDDLLLFRLDFDGFDPGRKDSLEKYVAYQLRKQFGDEEAEESAGQARETLLSLAGELAGSFLNAAGLFFLLKGAVYLGDRLNEAAPTFRRLAGPEPEPEERLRAILDLLSADARLVLHMKDTVLPDPVGRSLIHEPRRNPKLMVVLSCRRPYARGDLIAGERVARSYALVPYDEAATRRAVDARFAPNRFPREFYQALWRYTSGLPRSIALAMASLVKGEGVLGGGRHEPWRLPPDGMDAPQVADYFAENFYRSLNALRDSSAPVEGHILRFVEMAALCGENVPARLLARSMGLSPGEVDELLDRVDALAGEDPEKPLFHSSEYWHPLMRGADGEPELVYRFTDSGDRLLVLNQMYARDRQRIAGELLAYLKSTVRIRTRGIAALFYGLSQHLPEDSEERRHYERCLQWWIGPEEARALTEDLKRGVLENALDPDPLWRLALEMDEWPPYRRLALLDAYGVRHDGIPFDLLPLFHFLRGSQLLLLGSLQDAADACDAGLSVTQGVRDGLVLQLHRTACKCHMEQGEWPRMHVHAREAFALQKALHGLESAAGAHCAALLALGEFRTGATAEAVETLRLALDLADAYAQDDDPALGGCMSALGVCLSGVGHKVEAKRCFERALRFEELQPGTTYLERMNLAISLANLASVHEDLGNTEAARELFERSLRRAEELNGPDHPFVAQMVLRLLLLALRSDDGRAASGYADWLRDLAQSENEEVRQVVANSVLFVSLAKMERAAATRPANDPPAEPGSAPAVEVAQGV